MKQEKYYNIFMEKIKNKELQLDLQNGVILDLIYDNEIKAYRGYWEEEKIYLGIWEIPFLAEIIVGKIEGINLI